MHQPRMTPRPSIYYDYQVYPFETAPEQRGEKHRYPVVVVGAGPIGVTTALELARQGIASVLIESECQVSEGSRAIVFTRRSMEILQQVGVTERMLETALPWRYGNSIYRAKRVFRMEAPYDEDDRFEPMNNLQQQYLEQYLIERAQQEPLIEIRWGTKVTGLENRDDGVRLDVDTPEGPYSLECDWLVAADGARSVVRQLLGLRMEGDSYSGNFVIADIRIDIDLPTERLAYFDPDWNPGNTILMHREPGGIWRLDYQLSDDETPEQALAPESLQRSIQAQLDMIGVDAPWELDWSSVYSARALTLPDYVNRRVLFTGDAAHLLPIFGVRGANTGFQDCQNLAWKLAYVANGLADRRLLDSYSHERVGAAREIVAEAGKSTRFMTPPSRGFRLLRDAVLSLSLSESFVGPLFHWRTSRPHDYADSPLNAAADDNVRFTAGPANGAPLQNIRFGDDDYLFDHLPKGFCLLYFGDDPAQPQALAAQAERMRAQGLPISVLTVSRSGEHRPEQQTLADPVGHCFDRYGARSGSAYLVRPDQHVCGRWLQLNIDELPRLLDQALLIQEKS
ncbi:oxidoreductase [Marinobacterium nitratireducens]|uniref:Oxidoreductase n=1 Tax=Marinobacterium nitratireducens TaxID=518897 RepID=A0A918DQ27_9GAMM|nr:FAD-dependent monooxygenase [Marinobacterium nitratireducens]GGO79211.1 oxidoreductase [Marinobacterium nitratireducens]